MSGPPHSSQWMGVLGEDTMSRRWASLAVGRDTVRGSSMAFRTGKGKRVVEHVAD